MSVDDRSIGYSRSAEYPSSPRTPALSSTLSPRLKATRSSGRTPDISPHRLPPRLDVEQAGLTALPPPQIHIDVQGDNGYLQQNDIELDEKYRDLAYNQHTQNGRAAPHGSTSPSDRFLRQVEDLSSPRNTALGLNMPVSPGRRVSWGRPPPPSAVLCEGNIEDPSSFGRIQERRSGISTSGIRAFLVNPLAIPKSHPYLRILSTIIVYGLTLTVVSSWLGSTSAVGDSAIIQRIKGSQQSALSDTEILRLAENLRLSSVFPLPPNRPIDKYGSPNAAYRALHPLAPPPAPFPELRATRFLPDRCLEGWFIHGEIMCSRAEIGEEDQL